MTSRALLWSEQLAPRLVSEQQRVLLDYYRANAWANRQSALRLDRAAVWAWDQEELQQQVFLLRRAVEDGAVELRAVALRRAGPAHVFGHRVVKERERVGRLGGGGGQTLEGQQLGQGGLGLVLAQALQAVGEPGFHRFHAVHAQAAAVL